MELILASNNRGKIEEIKALLPDLTVRSMAEIGYTEAIAEPFDTFRENAFTKADHVHRFCGKPVLADDSGLCVDALNGAPGVFSARYAGEEATDTANNRKLLAALAGIQNRKAHYVAVLCLMIGGVASYFEARCSGIITEEEQGRGGFGYDPLFIPDGYSLTFGSIDPAIKRVISHRAKALQQLKGAGLLAAL